METEASIRFDHFACPVDDLVKAEDFYTKTFEVPFFERRRLRVIDVRAGTLPRTFLNVAGSRVSLFRAANRCPKTRNCTALQRLASGSQRRLRAHSPALREKPTVKFDGPLLRRSLC